MASASDLAELDALIAQAAALESNSPPQQVRPAKPPQPTIGRAVQTTHPSGPPGRRPGGDSTAAVPAAELESLELAMERQYSAELAGKVETLTAALVAAASDSKQAQARSAAALREALEAQRVTHATALQEAYSTVQSAAQALAAASVAEARRAADTAVHEAHEEAAMLRARISTLEQQLETLASAEGRAAEERERVAEVKKLWKGVVETMREETDALAVALEEAQAVEHRLADEVVVARQAAQRAAEEAATLREGISALQESRDAERTEHAAARAELEQLRAQFEVLRLTAGAREAHRAESAVAAAAAAAGATPGAAPVGSDDCRAAERVSTPAEPPTALHPPVSFTPQMSLTPTRMDSPSPSPLAAPPPHVTAAQEGGALNASVPILDRGYTGTNADAGSSPSHAPPPFTESPRRDASAPFAPAPLEPLRTPINSSLPSQPSEGRLQYASGGGVTAPATAEALVASWTERSRPQLPASNRDAWPAPVPSSYSGALVSQGLAPTWSRPMAADAAAAPARPAPSGRAVPPLSDTSLQVATVTLAPSYPLPLVPEQTDRPWLSVAAAPVPAPAPAAVPAARQHRRAPPPPRPAAAATTLARPMTVFSDLDESTRASIPPNLPLRPGLAALSASTQQPPSTTAAPAVGVRSELLPTADSYPRRPSVLQPPLSRGPPTDLESRVAAGPLPSRKFSLADALAGVTPEFMAPTPPAITDTMVGTVVASLPVPPVQALHVALPRHHPTGEHVTPKPSPKLSGPAAAAATLRELPAPAVVEARVHASLDAERARLAVEDGALQRRVEELRQAAAALVGERRPQPPSAH